MTERYDGQAARHYAAFRPPLHRLALERVLGTGERFAVGLDVGCGTGYSTVALADFCDRVFGIDPSPAMLKAAPPHPRITYLPGLGESLSSLPAPRFDVVTFAGSLVYTKSDALRRELTRVCPPSGTVVVYDFEILLAPFVEELGIARPEVASDYDHQLNLSDWPEFELVSDGTERIRLSASAGELAHLLLSDSHRYDALARNFPDADPFDRLVARLAEFRVQDRLEADLYFTRYQVAGTSRTTAPGPA